MNIDNDLYNMNSDIDDVNYNDLTNKIIAKSHGLKQKEILINQHAKKSIAVFSLCFLILGTSIFYTNSYKKSDITNDDVLNSLMYEDSFYIL